MFFIYVNDLDCYFVNVWLEFFLEWIYVIEEWNWMWFVYIYGFVSFFIFFMLYVVFFFFWF